MIKTDGRMNKPKAEILLVGQKRVFDQPVGFLRLNLPTVKIKFCKKNWNNLLKN